MKFSCHTSALLSGLSVAVRALSSRTTQPILEGVLVKSLDRGLELTCSDGAISIVTTVEAEISEEGAVVLPGKLFLDVVRKMPQALMTVTVGETFVSSMRCLGARMTLAGQSGDLFPSLPLVSAENSFELPQTLLRDMMQETAFAIAVDDPRKVLNGCLLEIAHGEARMIALDGFRLALRLARLSGDAPEISAIIPGKAVAEIAKILGSEDEKMAHVKIGGTQMMVELDETQLYSTLIEGEYINYRHILPSEWKTRVKIDRDQFAMCVDRASLIAREGRNNLIKMQIEDGRMIITSNSESGDAYEELEVEVEGEGLSIAFNVVYVSDILRVLPEGEAYMRFNSPVSPCLVCPVEGDAFAYLMLPVRVNA